MRLTLQDARFMTADREAKWPTVLSASLAAAVVAALPAAALAGHKLLLNGGKEPMIEFAQDKPVKADHHLTESISVGARFELETNSEINFDLDDQEDEDIHEAEPQLLGAFAYEPNVRLRAYTELKLSQELVLDGPPDEENSDVRLKLKQAYVTLRDIVDGVSLSVGRQYMGDEREWLFDEDLDGATLHWRDTDLALEIAYRREGIVRRDLFSGDERKNPDFFIARGFHAIDDDSRVSPFVIYQNGYEGRTDEDLLFLGLQTYAELAHEVDAWADGALVLGEAKGRDVRGFGFDVGLVKTFNDLPLQPYFTAAAAFGSGDDGSGTDTAFRQTSLQDNSDKFGGVTSLQYYGEVLDPELSNLGILTLGAGFRPSRHSSIDVVYHRYLQPRLQDDFRDVAIDEKPEGERRHVGDGIDIVVGFEEIGNFNVKLVGGVFLPGSAFEDDDPAFLGGVTFLYKL